MKYTHASASSLTTYGGREIRGGSNDLERRWRGEHSGSCKCRYIFVAVCMCCDKVCRSQAIAPRPADRVSLIDFVRSHQASPMRSHSLDAHARRGQLTQARHNGGAPSMKHETHVGKRTRRRKRTHVRRRRVRLFPNRRIIFNK